jgi:transposase
MSDPGPSPRRSREATRQVWVERLARFGTAEQSIATFCAAEGVSVNSFFYWKRRLADPAVVSDAEPCFLPVRVTPPAPVEIVLPNGATLRLAPGCDLAFVRRLIDALAGAPC